MAWFVVRAGGGAWVLLIHAHFVVVADPRVCRQYAHTRTHTHTHTHTHTRAHTYTRVHTYTHTKTTKNIQQQKTLQHQKTKTKTKTNTNTNTHQKKQHHVKTNPEWRHSQQYVPDDFCSGDQQHRHLCQHLRTNAVHFRPSRQW